MDFSLDDKVALVTGGSRGIGYGCADALAAEGCDLTICARHEDELEEAAANLKRRGGAVEPVVAEMMEQAAAEQGISKEEAIENFLDTNRPHIELRRPGQIDEVGPLVAFLASEQASFINGANYRVDGGSVAAM